MKNRTNPLSHHRQLLDLGRKDSQIFLGPNTFIDNSGRLGLFSSNSEENSREFLTVKSVVSDLSSETHIKLLLSDTRHTYERSSFTLMMLLGELGGIYGVIIGIPSLFISGFVEH